MRYKRTAWLTCFIAGSHRYSPAAIDMYYVLDMCFAQEISGEYHIETERRAVISNLPQGKYIEPSVATAYRQNRNNFNRHRSNASYALIKDYNQLFVCLEGTSLQLTKAPLCKGSSAVGGEGLYQSKKESVNAVKL